MHNNAIADDSCNAIEDALKSNAALQALYLNGTPISESTAYRIVHSLEVNNTLVELRLPLYSDDVIKELKHMQLTVNEKRNRQGCQVLLNITRLSS